jgi:hypothetical protein
MKRLGCTIGLSDKFVHFCSVDELKEAIRLQKEFMDYEHKVWHRVNETPAEGCPDCKTLQ